MLFYFLMGKAFYILFSNYSQSTGKFCLKKPHSSALQSTAIITPKWELQTGWREQRGSTLGNTKPALKGPELTVRHLFIYLQ